MSKPLRAPTGRLENRFKPIVASGKTKPRSLDTETQDPKKGIKVKKKKAYVLSSDGVVKT